LTRGLHTCYLGHRLAVLLPQAIDAGTHQCSDHDPDKGADRRIRPQAIAKILERGHVRQMSGRRLRFGHWRSIGRFPKLLFEFREDLFVVELEDSRILPDETAGEHATWKTIELVRFDSFELMPADLGLASHLVEI
jgi:hypothetical protein